MLMAQKPVLVDYGALQVRRSATEQLMGRPGHRPIALAFAAAFFLAMVLLPVPAGLIELVEGVNPPGYDMLEGGTETIVDSVNFHKHPEAFNALAQASGVSTQREGLDSSNDIARLGMIMLGILVVAALLGGPRPCPSRAPSPSWRC